MKIEHNSHISLYRSPFGAVKSSTSVTIRLLLTDFGIPSHIKLIYEFSGTNMGVDMAYVFPVSDGYMYEATIEIPDDTGLLFYYFDIASENGRFYYGNNAECLGGRGEVYTQKPEKMFQITVYDKNLKTPEWWKNSVCYQIFPDRFCNGNADGSFLGDRDDIIKRNWGDEPFYKAEQFGGEYLSNDFFGGNLLGIEKKLDYLKELGISAIYLNPIFKAYSNHKYDTGDYKTIDPMFGTEADFERLSKKAEKLGISIILDGVFNHTGSDSLYFNKRGTYPSVGAYQSKESPYYSWYRFSDYPDEYESWWGIDTLPQIEENSQEYQKYILTDTDSVVKKWLKKGAKGWRLDVVDELPDFFVKILRREVKSQNPDAVIIGEVWEDASNKVAYGEQRQYFMGDELDSVMNYPLKNAMIDFANGKITAEGFDKKIMSLKENYPKECFYSLFNFLSSHDTLRVLTALGDKNLQGRETQANAWLDNNEKETAKAKLKCLLTMQMLFPGVPVIYYGDEVGMEGYADPFCRRCYPWGKEDHDLLSAYKNAIAIRKSSDVFVQGEFETVYKYENGYGFTRFDGEQKYFVLVNMGSSTTFRLDISRYNAKLIKQLNETEEYSSNDGIYFIPMEKYKVKVFKTEKSTK